jgi:hypothetical protein
LSIETPQHGLPPCQHSGSQNSEGQVVGAVCPHSASNTGPATPRLACLLADRWRRHHQTVDRSLADQQLLEQCSGGALGREGGKGGCALLMLPPLLPRPIILQQGQDLLAPAALVDSSNAPSPLPSLPATHPNPTPPVDHPLPPTPPPCDPTPKP